MIELELTHIFPADADTVFGLFCNKAFIEERLEILVANTKVIRQHDVEPGGLTVSVFSTLSRSKLPKAVRGFVRGEPEVTRTERWHRAENGYAGETEVDLKGPGNVVGHMSLTNSAAGTSTVEVRFEIKVPIPMFGSEVEKTLQGEITEIMETEAEFLNNYIAAKSASDH